MSESKTVCPNCRRVVPVMDGRGNAMQRCLECGARLTQDPVASVPAGAAAGAPEPAIAFVVSPAAAPAEQQALPQTLILQGAHAGPPAECASTAAPGPVVNAAAPVVTAGERPIRRRFGTWEVIKIVLGGAAGLGLGYLVVLAIQSRQVEQPKEQQAKTQRQPVASRVSAGDRFPEFKRPKETGAPALPAFVPPSVGFGPPETASPPVTPASSSAASAPKASDHPVRPSPPTPAAPPPKQALDGLAKVSKIPPIVDTSPVALSQVHVPNGKTLEISLNSVAANIPAASAFFTEAQQQAPASWLVCYAADLNGSPGDKKVLAEMKHAAGELTFQWRTPIEDVEVRKELGNCLLRVTCDNASRTTLLRSPTEIPRLVVDLNREVVIHSLVAADVPKEESLRLEIAELIGFPGGAVLKDDRRVLKLKERTVVQFQKVQGAEIQLEFKRHPSGELQLVMRPEFRENAVDKFAMTLQRLETLKDGMEKSIPKSEARIVALGKELQALDRALKDLGPRPASGAAFVAWQTKMRGLQSDASSAKSELTRLQRKVPEMKARLALVPQMKQFLDDMHRKAALVVRAYAECGDARLVLVDSRLDPAADSQQPGS